MRLGGNYGDHSGTPCGQALPRRPRDRIRPTVNSTIARALTMLARSPATSARELDGFVDSLLQSFENCRPGLNDQLLGAQGEAPEAFFTSLYEKEIPRLKDIIRREESILDAPAREAFLRKVDDLIRQVVIPAYVRLAVRFTPRERNAFYLAPEPFHGLERFGWAVAGVVVGALVILAPFIPLWSKEWIIPFMLGGLIFPNVRRFLMVRQYEAELNRVVAQGRRRDRPHRFSLPDGRRAGGDGVARGIRRSLPRRSGAEDAHGELLMVEVFGKRSALDALKGSVKRLGILGVLGIVAVVFLYSACTVRVLPNELGVEQRKFGFKAGIVEKTFGPGLYFVGPGTTMHTFPREIHVLEAHDRAVAGRRPPSARSLRETGRCGRGTHRDHRRAQRPDLRRLRRDRRRHAPVLDRGPGEDGPGVRLGLALRRRVRHQHLPQRRPHDARQDERRVLLRRGGPHRRRARGGGDRSSSASPSAASSVEKLLLRNYRYADNYEKSLHDKKVAVQLTEKNRKESLVNEEKAKLQQIESKGNAAITIAESEVNAKIAKIRAEAELYSSQVRAKGDKEVNVAAAEAKRLKADALTQAGGRYVVALETAKMFDNIEGAVMTPEQYIAFIRNAWALIGVSPGGAAAGAAGRSERRRGSLARGLAAAPRARALGLRRDLLHRGRRAHPPRLGIFEKRGDAGDLRSRAASTSSCRSSTPGTRCRSPSRTCS